MCGRYAPCLFSLARFMYATEVHHRDVVADVFNNGEIVGNKQVRKAELARQIDH